MDKLQTKDDLEPKLKKTKAQLDSDLLLIVHTLRPEEEIRIFKDARGYPGRIVVVARKTIFLDYNEEI